MRVLSKVPQALIRKADKEDFDEQKHKRAGDGKFTSGSGGGGGGAKSKDKKKDKTAPSSSQTEKKSKKEAGRKLRNADAKRDLRHEMIDMDFQNLLDNDDLKREAEEAELDDLLGGEKTPDEEFDRLNNRLESENLMEEESLNKLLEGATSEGAMSDEEFDQLNSKIESEKSGQGIQGKSAAETGKASSGVDSAIARVSAKSQLPPAVKKKKSRRKAKSFLRNMGEALMTIGGGAAWAFGKAEHYVADIVNKTIPNKLNTLTGTKGAIARGVWKATVMGTKAAFSAYTTGMAIAEQTALDTGATPTQARRIRNICVGLDMAGAKIVPLACKAVGLGGLGLAASFLLPMGSAMYVAYSGARRPVKTFKAAVKAVGKVIKGEAINPEADAAAEAEHAAEHAAKHGHDPHHKRYNAAVRKSSDSLTPTPDAEGEGGEDQHANSKRLLKIYHKASVRAGNPDRFDVLVRAAVSLTQDFAKALEIAIRAEAKYMRKDRTKKRSAVA